jgi:hypothetical protein
MQLQFWLHAGSTYTSGTLNDDALDSITNANRAAGIGSLFASTDNTLEITGIQLELGSQATPFEHRSIGEEKSLCYRYYEEGSFSMRVSGTVVRAGQSYTVSKRASATVNVYYDSSKPTAGTINVSNSTNSGWAEGGSNNYWNMEKNTGSNGDGVDYNGHWTADAEL